MVRRLAQIRRTLGNPEGLVISRTIGMMVVQLPYRTWDKVFPPSLEPFISEPEWDTSIKDLNDFERTQVLKTAEFSKQALTRRRWLNWFALVFFLVILGVELILVLKNQNQNEENQNEENQNENEGQSSTQFINQIIIGPIIFFIGLILYVVYSCSAARSMIQKSNAFYQEQKTLGLQFMSTWNSKYWTPRGVEASLTAGNMLSQDMTQYHHHMTQYHEILEFMTASADAKSATTVVFVSPTTAAPFVPSVPAPSYSSVSTAPAVPSVPSVPAPSSTATTTTLLPCPIPGCGAACSGPGALGQHLAATHKG